MSLNAYQQARTYSETPRAMEYRLVGDTTRDLVRAVEAGLTGIALMPVLHRNREMWSVFSMLCDDDRNALPVELRASIVSLAIWVDRHTSAVVRGKESPADLIAVNRTIMAGLEQHVEPSLVVS
ncbi:flagellar FlaF family protein [Sphingomonas sp. Leaf231]|uniref:flagellar biosynthesis regulator FlaF n=1 Tax=Sphingomonas sp. Leaf231 TaxID=1736301 RepID=UPI0006FFCD75|nr:flagellar biosynthesis regulator FlaF [Sphingomonas sp. Leaf231]KQN90039.1 flagellar FlaF family protein [Sphingomonas sp. Leaf231]